MDPPQLTLLSSSLVSPSTPTPPEHLFLSSMDLFWRDFHFNRRVLFYRPPPDRDLAQLIAHLKRSLALVLVHFYPVAGRVHKDENGRLVIDCNDKGVEFVEASIDAVLSELESDDFQPRPFFIKLAPGDEHPVSDVKRLPLLLIQVTKFKDGGISLGYSHNHMIGDGHSMWHFMKSWAEIARGEPISLPPLHMRTVLKIDNPSKEIAGLNHETAEDTGTGETGAVKPQGELAQRVFHFTAGMLGKLKEEAARGLEGVRLTTYEVLCAHFWRCTVRALQVEDEELLKFVPLVNMRSRMRPPIPASFFGNLADFSFGDAKARELREESLAETALRVREVVGRCTDAALWAKLNWLELHDNSFGTTLSFKNHTMKATSSPRFPVYDVDYGFGPPASVRPAKVQGDGEMVLFPGRHEPGSIDICMPLRPAVMERLEKDPSFLHF